MEAAAKDLMEMKVAELKEELAARDEPLSGNKAWLRRRLHAAIVRTHLEGGRGGLGPEITFSVLLKFCT